MFDAIVGCIVAGSSGFEGRRRQREREKVRECFTGFYPSLPLLFVGFENITQVK